MKKLENVADIYPLTPSQAGMLYHSLYAAESEVYIEQIRCDLIGRFDPERFKAAWALAVERHPILRTMFIWQGVDDPLQVVRQKVDLPWRYEDWREESARYDTSELLNDRLAGIASEIRCTGFDLAKAPILDLTLLHLGDEKTHFIWTSHHILLDGWSTPQIFDEVFDTYDALGQNREPDLPPVYPFKRYIAWLKKQDAAAAETFWRQEVAGFEAATPLQIDRHAPETEIAYGRQSRTLSNELSTKLRAFAKKERLTLNTLIQGAWSILLSRYSGNDDVLFGVTMSGRPTNLPHVDKIMGMFINTLPLRLQLDQEAPLLPWLQQVQKRQLAIGQFEYSSLADIQRWSDLPAGQPLFESIVVFENFPTPENRPDRSLQMENASVFELSNYPLILLVLPGEEIELILDYNHARFEATPVKRLLFHLENILNGMLARPESEIGRLPLLSEAERREMLLTWNDTVTPYPDATTVHAQFEAQAMRTPEKTALIFEGKEMSYAELREKSNRLAHKLIEMGVGPEVPVGIAMYRSFEMIIGLLATVKAGGVYVPLDPNYPADRLSLILEDVDIAVLLTTSVVQATFPTTDGPAIALDTFDGLHYATEAPETATGPDSSLFITFTSGSTGRPKGVQGHHRGVLNRCQWQWDHYPLDQNEICAQKTTLNFVDHLWEIWGPLLKGTPLLLIPEETVKDGAAFVDTLARYEIERIVLVPSFIRVLLESYPDLHQRLPKLKYWTFSGEPVSRALADRFRQQMPHAILLDFYGMSEVTLDASWYDDRWGIESEMVPIGKPISNMRCYILDKQLRPVPVGVPGEIYVSGVGLSRGYHGRDDLTAERFFPNHLLDRDDPHFSENSRIYKSGDLGRWLPDGHIEYIGRADHQVKIRGFRIEPAEIEAVIRDHPAVNEVIVLARNLGGTADIGEKQLIAYVLPHKPVDIDTLRTLVAAHLPDYMVPAIFQLLDQLPRTPNGKIDRKALPVPTLQRSGEGGLVDPSDLTDTEQGMIEVWEVLLGLEGIGLDADFFEIGGHSLLALRLATRIKKKFDVNVPIATLLGASTVRQLAAQVDQQILRAADPAVSAEGWPLLVPIQAEGDKPPLYCVHGAGGNVLLYRDLAAQLKRYGLPVYGLQSQGQDGEQPFLESIEAMAKTYADEIVRHNPDGPYLLAGYCMGGSVALEIAQTLKRAGRSVLFVGLLETYDWRFKQGKSTRNSLTFHWERLYFHYRNFAQLGREGKSAFLHEKWHVLQERAALMTNGRITLGAKKNGDQAAGDAAQDQDNEMQERLKKLWAANDEATFAYEPRPYNGVITHFRPRRDYTLYQDVRCGWENIATNGVVTHRLPSFPAGMLIEPYVEQLATLIQKEIDEVLVGSRSVG